MGETCSTETSGEMAEDLGGWASEKDHGGHGQLLAAAERAGCEGVRLAFCGTVKGE